MEEKIKRASDSAGSASFLLKEGEAYRVGLAGLLKGREEARLSFLINRDGLDETKKFARRAIRIYRQAVLCKKGLFFRREFIESYLHFKRFTGK